MRYYSAPIKTNRTRQGKTQFEGYLLLPFNDLLSLGSANDRTKAVVHLCTGCHDSPCLKFICRCLLTILRKGCVVQGDKLVSRIANELLPALSGSSAAVIRGDLFTGAAKHAEALKNLASVWEALAKVLPHDLVGNLRAADKQMVQEACQTTHQNAATAKASSDSLDNFIEKAFVDCWAS